MILCMKKVTKKKLPLRPNVCMIILDRKNRIFLGERRGKPGHWQLPQGGRDPGETAKKAALREASEELGVSEKEFKAVKILKAKNNYDFQKVPRYARGKWRGQSQKFCVMHYLGKDSQIDLTRYDEEFMNFRWCTLKKVRILADPRRFAGYEKALEEFEEYLSLNHKK